MKNLVRILLLSAMSLVSVIANAQESVDLVFIGNSITYGALHKDPSKTAPPVKCTEWIGSQQGIGETHFLNMGKSGRTTFNFVPARTGIQNYWQELKAKTAQLVADHPADKLVFSIMLGTNDAAERPSNSRTTPSMYYHNMKLIVDSLLALYPRAIIVLHRPIFFSAPFVTRNGSIQDKTSQKMLTVYYKECVRLSKDYAKVNSGHVFTGDKDAYTFFKKNYHTMVNHEHGRDNCDFWLHPNEQGSAILAEYWGKAILKALHR